jgi:hypothetical protein
MAPLRGAAGFFVAFRAVGRLVAFAADFLAGALRAVFVAFAAVRFLPVVFFAVRDLAGADLLMQLSTV